MQKIRAVKVWPDTITRAEPDLNLLRENEPDPNRTDFDSKSTRFDRLVWKLVIFQFWANLSYFQGWHEIDSFINWVDRDRWVADRRWQHLIANNFSHQQFEEICVQWFPNTISHAFPTNHRVSFLSFCGALPFLLVLLFSLGMQTGMGDLTLWINNTSKANILKGKNSPQGEFWFNIG